MSDPKLKTQEDAAEGQHSENLDTVFAVHFHPNIKLLTDIIADIMISWKQTLLIVFAFVFLCDYLPNYNNQIWKYKHKYVAEMTERSKPGAVGIHIIYIHRKKNGYMLF